MPKFDLKKAGWKTLLGFSSFGISFFINQLLPQLIPPEIQTMTVGALMLEISDWILHKIGANK